MAVALLVFKLQVRSISVAETAFAVTLSTAPSVDVHRQLPLKPDGPAVSIARTRYQYCVFSDSPVSVYAVASPGREFVTRVKFVPSVDRSTSIAVALAEILLPTQIDGGLVDSGVAVSVWKRQRPDVGRGSEAGNAVCISRPHFVPIVVAFGDRGVLQKLVAEPLSVARCEKFVPSVDRSTSTSTKRTSVTSSVHWNIDQGRRHGSCHHAVLYKRVGEGVGRVGE